MACLIHSCRDCGYSITTNFEAPAACPACGGPDFHTTHDEGDARENKADDV